MSFEEAVSRGIPGECWEKRFLGRADAGPGEWPRAFSEWFPPAWAIAEGTLQLLPYQWPLTVELVPRGAWQANVRSQVPQEEWDLIRRATYRRAGYECEICGGQGKKNAPSNHSVEAHEQWRYDDLHKTQTLQGLRALCPACHQVKHIDKAKVDGRFGEALGHLAGVNDWDPLQAELYVKQQFLKWEERSRYDWTLDLGPLESEKHRAWLRYERRRLQKNAAPQENAVP